MSKASHDLRSVSSWVFLAVAAFVLVIAMQWFYPSRTVGPIADRFLCPGAVEVTAAKGTTETSIFNQVECVEGLRREDVSFLAMVVLAIPSVLVVFSAAYLMRRMSSQPRTRIRRAPS